MKSALSRLPLAIGVMLVCIGSSLSASELQYTDLENRLGTLATKKAPSYVEPASFLQDTELPLAAPIQDKPPRELAASSEMDGESTPCREGCACDKCRLPAVHGVYFAEVQVYWMRPHVNEGAVGKLSEQYELSPRLIIGYEDAGGVGARARYWSYGRTTPNLAAAADDLRFEFEVLDLEATSRFGNERSEVVVSGGMRWADLEIMVEDEQVTSDMPGISFAADLRTMLCRNCNSEWASVAGARWSILGGDWEGSSAGFLSPDRDDNVTVTEIYGGFEYVQHYRGYDVYGRLVLEIQNWHSDVAAQTAGSDSIGFVGPGVHLGMNF